MDEDRLRRLSPHILFILLSIVIPILSVYISYIQHVLPWLIIISTPIIVMLIIFILGHRYLTGIDIELYGGLSGRFLILSSILFMGFNGFAEFLMIPFYGFIVPVETFIILFIGSLAYNYIGSANYHILTLIYNTIFILSFLSIIALYLYLIFMGRRYQEKVMKIYYLIAIIFGFTIVIGGIGSRFLTYILSMQFLFISATLARWISKIRGIR